MNILDHALSDNVASNPNLLINGSFQVQERSGSARKTNGTGYMVDRWACASGKPGNVIQAMEQATTDGSRRAWGAYDVHKLDINHSRDPGDSWGYQFGQRVELPKHAVLGHTLTYSFTAYVEDGPKNIAVEPILFDPDNGLAYVFPAKVITLSANHARYAVTQEFPFRVEDLPDPVVSMSYKSYISFAIWASRGSTSGERGGGEAVPVQNIVLRTANHKLEYGPVATPFVKPRYQDDLLACQRYYHRKFFYQFNPMGLFRGSDNNIATSTTFEFPTTMQRVPTVTIDVADNGYIADWPNIDSSAWGNTALPTKTALQVGATERHYDLEVVGHTENNRLSVFAPYSASPTIHFDAEL